MVTNYQRGRTFEYRVKQHLEKHGYYVVRSAGSHFPDLIAIKNGKVLAIEVKRYKPPQSVIQEVEQKAHELIRYGITPCLAFLDRDGRIRLVVL
jgi:Holliday junction resolvase